MSRHETLIVKETHRGLLYEDGILREVLPAGRYRIPIPASGLAAFFQGRAPRVEVTLVDVRGRDRTVLVPEVLTAEGATIAASFVLQYRVVDPRAAVHEVKNFEDRLVGETQSAARRALRGMTLDEVLGCRDELGEELHRQVGESASAYGLEVTALDFKELDLPAELRDALNRVALARRIRLAEMAEARAAEDADASPAIADPEESEAILSRLHFGREAVHGGRPAGPHPGGSDHLLRLRP